jgi:PD-(D/E)XK nuclease superfamily protein
VSSRIRYLSRLVIGRAIDVHRELGPGLLESTYEECLACELQKASLKFERQKSVPLVYKTLQLDGGYRPKLCALCAFVVNYPLCVLSRSLCVFPKELRTRRAAAMQMQESATLKEGQAYSWI